MTRNFLCRKDFSVSVPWREGLAYLSVGRIFCLCSVARGTRLPREVGRILLSTSVARGTHLAQEGWNDSFVYFRGEKDSPVYVPRVLTEEVSRKTSWGPVAMLGGLELLLYEFGVGRWQGLLTGLQVGVGVQGMSRGGTRTCGWFSVRGEV